MERSGMGRLATGVLAFAVAGLALGGCNRHQAHDEDEDDAPSAEAAATSGSPPAARAPAADASADATANSPSASASGDAAATSPAPADASSAAPSADSSTAAAAPSEPAPAEPAAAPAPAEPAAETAAAAPAPAEPSAPAAAPATSHKKAKASPPPAAALVAWWMPGSTAPFSVRAVGPAADRHGLVIVLAKDVDPAAASQHLHLTHKGKPVSGTWHAGANAHVLALDPLDPGTYELAIDAGLASTDGTTLGSKLKGPVFVR